MKKNTLYSALIFIWLINGCSNDTTKTEIKEVETIKAEATKSSMPETMKAEATKSSMPETMKVKENMMKAPQKSGKDLYDAKCASCHGPQGKLKALGKSNIITGQDTETLFKSLVEYKEGTRNISGMGGLMKAQLMTYSKEDLRAVSKYISSF